VLSPLAHALGRPKAYRLDARRIQLPNRVGTTFDGRDLFAPAAARVAAGESLARLGTRAPFREAALAEAVRGSASATGQIVHVDHFGNLISNVPTEWVPPGLRHLSVTVGRRRPVRLPWVASYEALSRGKLGVLGSSFGTAEVAVANGNAAQRFRGRPGTALGFGWPAGGASATETVNTGRSLRRRRP
jgi:hypothetical protein